MSDSRLAPIPAKPTARRYAIGGGVCLITIWWAVSAAVGPLVLASPWSAFAALIEMAAEPGFYGDLFKTLGRLLAILCLAGVGGTLLAIPAAFDRRVEQALEPFRWLCMTVPPVLFIVILMFCMGMGSRMIVVFGAGLLWPVMYVNVLKGSETIDANLWEMARVYRVSWPARLWHFFLPAVMPSAMAGAAQVICSAIRVTVLAELIGASDGIGAAIASTARNLDSSRMYGWALVVLMLAIAMEFGLLRPLQRRAYRWKTS